jgi:hypothetical protein
MPGVFAWIDFSDSERRRNLDLLQLLAAEDTRDELGLSVVRDALAELLFPGTGSLQTRARYFLFVPWMSLRLTRLAEKGRGDEVARKARKHELRLAEIIEKNPNNRGNIGSSAKERLKRLPSNIYWSGLRRWHILGYSGSQNQYHRDFEVLHGSTASADDDGAPVTDGVTEVWHRHLPKAPDDFPESASFALRADEAAYLRDRIRSLGESLLLSLVDAAAGGEQRGLPWEHPAAAGLPPPIKEQLDHARCFSEAMHGAALLYNLMLAEKRSIDERAKEYRTALAEWAGRLETRRGKLVDWWKGGAFWGLVERAGGRPGRQTRSFVSGWVDLVLPDAGRGVGALAEARRLVEARELHVKGRRRARLGNSEALARWGGRSGASQIDYRWSSVRTIVADIRRGLGREA